MLLVQHYLLNKTFGELSVEHGVYASFAKSGYKFSLNYSMVETRDDDVLAQQCRGLILATVDGKPLTSRVLTANGKLDYDAVCPGQTIVLGYAFNRFFNEGQAAASSIQWNDPQLKVQEKIDGTLCLCGFDRFSNSWFVATRSVPEADIPLDGNGRLTFRILFEKALYETLQLSWVDFTNRLNKDYTYCFELTTPLNQIVVRQSEYRIALLGVRYLPTQQEISIYQPEFDVFPKPQVYPFADLKDILGYVSAQDPLQHEGVVVLDSKFNRIKIKNINYVLLNKSRDVLCNDRAFLNLVLNEKEDDVWAVLPPDFQQRVLDLKERVLAYNHEIMIEYRKLREQSNSKKDFALQVLVKKLWGAPFFQMFDRRCDDFRGFIAMNKLEDGSFSNSFLDKLLSVI